MRWIRSVLVTSIACVSTPPAAFAGRGCEGSVATALFTRAAGGRVAAAPEAGCAIPRDALSCPAGSMDVDATEVTLREPAPPRPPRSAARAVSFTAGVGRVAFRGDGGPARLELEVQAEDVPPGFSAGSMRAFVSCAALPLPGLPAPPDAVRSDAWCMPAADPELDEVASTVATRILDLPAAAALLPGIVRIDTPAERVYTRSTTLHVAGHLVEFDGQLWGPRGSFAGYAVALERTGEQTSGTVTPAVDLANGLWSDPALALEENENRLTAWAQDPSLGRSFDRVTVVRDTIAPVVALEGVTAGAHVHGPVALAAAEVERWPGTHVLAGTRTLVEFLGEPPVVEGIAADDRVMTLLDETPPSRRRLGVPPLAADGEYALRFLATDRAGNEGESRIAFTIDTVAPVVSLGGAEDGRLYRVSPYVSVLVTDRNLADVAVDATVDGAPTRELVCDDTEPDPRVLSCGDHAGREGEWTVTVLARDRAGNEAPPSRRRFTVDRTRPAVTVGGAAEGEFRREPFAVDVRITDLHRDPSREESVLEREGIEVARSTAPDPTFTIEIEGEYRLAVRATDLAGNVTVVERSFGLDLHDPVIAFVEPGEGAYVRGEALAVSGSVDERFLAGVRVDPGGSEASFASGSWLQPRVAVPPGRTTLEVTATDRAGRTGTASREVVRDDAAPVLAVGAPADGTLTNARETRVTGMATDDALAWVRVGGRTLDAPATGPLPFDVIAALEEGDNHIVVEAQDRAGNAASETRSVVRDTRCDRLLLRAPGDGHRTRAERLRFTGSAADRHGMTVRVAGTEAPLAGEEFDVEVSLAAGESLIEVVGTDGAGNTCRASVRVTSDRQPPQLLRADPADGTPDLAPEAAVALEFSEVVVLNGGVRGSAPARVTALGSRATVAPLGAWPSDAEVTIEVTTDVTDAVGNPLGAARTLRFRTADRTPPPPPLLDELPDVTAEVELDVCGSIAEAGRLSAETAAGRQEASFSAGRFCLRVPLERGSTSEVVVTLRDGAGNVSLPVIDWVQQEGSAPSVVSATIAPDGSVGISFSRAMDPSSVDRSTVLVSDGTRARTVDVMPDGATASVRSTDSLDLLTQPFILTVTTGTRDVLGTPLGARFTRLFNGGSGFLTGEAYDASTGLRLAGVEVEVLSVEGRPPAAPAPRATTDATGAFALNVAEPGLTWVRARASGYTEVEREVAASAGLVTPVFDVRLTPVSPDSLSVPPAGGTLRAQEGAIQLTVPPRTPASSLTLTRLEAQGLAARLPAGWSPVEAVEIAPLEIVFPSPSTLRLANSSGVVPGDAPALVRYDRDAHVWVAGPPLAISGDGRTLVSAIERGGSYAVVVADASSPLPLRAATGEALPGIPRTQVTAPPDLAGALALAPDTILPSGRSSGSLRLASAAAMTSGLPLQADVRERLELVDSTVLELPAYTADLSSFQGLARFPVTPEATPGLEVFREGLIRVRVSEFPEDVAQGGVVGRDGGSIRIGTLGLDVPAGAVDAATPVTLEEQSEGDLPLPLPAACALVQAIDVELGGSTLRTGGRLSAELAARGGAGRLVLLRAARAFGMYHWVYVAPAEVEPPGVPGGPERLRSSATSPGVRTAGTHAFVRIERPFGTLEGSVLDTAPPGARVDGALVTSDADFPAGLTYGGGLIAALAPEGDPVPVAGRSPVTEDEGSVLTNVIGGALGTVEIRLVPTPPVVLSTEPGNGADGVALDAAVSVTFSEAVDPRTLAGGITVAAGGTPVEGSVYAARGGRGAVFVPRMPFPANAEVVAVVEDTVRDRTGHAAVPYGFRFHTIDTEPPSPPPPGAVRVLAPDAQGLICVEAPDVDGAIAVVASNARTQESRGLLRDPSRSVWAGCLAGAYGDTIRVAFLDAEGNSSVEEHDLFLEPDTAAPTARVGLRGGSFVATDADGTIAVTIPPGAFDEPTLVRLDPELPGFEPLPDPPQAFDVVGGFTLGLEGREAARDLVLSFDPGSVTPGDTVLLVRMVEVLGRIYPEFVAQMELADGRLSTRVPALTLATAPEAFAAGSRRGAAGEDAVGDPPDVQNVPGTRREGVFRLFRQVQAQIGFFLTYGPYGVAGLSVGAGGFDPFAYMSYERWPMVLPVRAGLETEVRILDPLTGRQIFGGRIPPINEGHGASDTERGSTLAPVQVTSAAPVRVHRFAVTRTVETLAPGITAIAQAPSTPNGIPLPPEFPLLLRGEPASVPPGARVRATVRHREPGSAPGSEPVFAGEVTEVTAGSDGAFVAGGATFLVSVGDTVLLAIERVDVDPAAEFVIELDRPLTAADVRAAASIVEVDAAGAVPIPLEVTRGAGRSYVLRPLRVLASGVLYELRLSELRIDPPFQARFRTRSFAPTWQYSLPDANEVVKVGSVLFVAAGASGLVVLDASYPDGARPLGQAPTIGAARGITAYDAAQQPGSRSLRIAVCGGGEHGPGFLRLYDVSTPARLASPEPLAGEVASSRVGAPESERYENLGDGVPLRVRAATIGGRPYAFVAVLGLGLEAFDVERMTSSPTRPPLRPSAIAGIHRAEEIVDVALYRPHAPASSSTPQLRAVIARNTAGIEVLDVSAPHAIASLGRLVLAGRAVSVAVFPRFPLEIEGVQTERDLAFVGRGADGIDVVDLSGDLRHPSVIGHFPVDGQVFDLALDVRGRRAFVNLGSGGIVLLDVSRPAVLHEPGSPIVLGRFSAQGGTFNTGLVPDVDLGVVYGSSEGQGVVAARFALPYPRFVQVPEAAGGQLAELVEIVPRGLASERADPARGLAAVPHTERVHVAIALPGGIGTTAHVAVEPLDAYGSPAREPGYPGMLGRLPALALQRRSDDLTSDEYDLFVSPEIAFTANPASLAPVPLTTVAAGDRIRARLVDRTTGAPASSPDLGWLSRDELAVAQSTVRSWRLDLVPGPSPEPPAGASTGLGEVRNVLLHSGEFVWSDTDRALPGRVLHFALSRHTRSQSVYNGPFGRGWDSPYLMRVRRLPNGALEWFDGTGRSLVLPKSRAAARHFEVPSGEQVVPRPNGDRLELVGKGGTVATFNPEGDLERLEDHRGRSSLQFLRGPEGGSRPSATSSGVTTRSDGTPRGESPRSPIRRERRSATVTTRPGLWRRAPGTGGRCGTGMKVQGPYATRSAP